MKRQIITGETGSGKTYHAIKDEEMSGNKFIYIAPCRQLVYESFMKYATEQDSLATGEVKIYGIKNAFMVYESCNETILEKFDTLIIDEAHFLSDEERGIHLNNLMIYCFKNNKNIKLVTATQNFKHIKRFETIELKQKFKVPEKKEVSFQEAYNNIKNGMQTIWFVPSINDTELIASRLRSQNINAVAFNSSMLPSDRLDLQIKFAKKEVQVVVCTNVLGQGVNFECQNLIIYEDYFNTPELIEQKLGRLGRPFLGEFDEVFYAMDESRYIIKKHTLKIKKGEREKDFIEYQIEKFKSFLSGEIPRLGYNDIKYALPEVKTLIKNDFMHRSGRIRKLSQKIITLIILEERRIREIITSNMKLI